MSLLLSSITILILIVLIDITEGHGRLSEPPGRSSLWREGFKVPRNYDDNQLFCGGFYRQHVINNGKCGVCGDPFDVYPRDNERPSGIYAKKKIISRTYIQGQDIQVTVQIKAAHKGFFEFRLCPHNDFETEATEDCLNKNVLYIKGSGKRFDFTSGTEGYYSMDLQLPSHITCYQCVLQWKYKTGNSWGCDWPGNCAVGKGKQEEFYSCADIAIRPIDGADITVEQTSVPTSTQFRSILTTAMAQTSTKSATTPRETKVDLGTGICVSTEIWQNQKLAMDMWCIYNCELRNFCPEMFCRCTTLAYLGYNMVNPIDQTGLTRYRSTVDKFEYHQWCDTHCPLGLCPDILCYPLI